jgi:hypothetical protein
MCSNNICTRIPACGWPHHCLLVLFHRCHHQSAAQIRNSIPIAIATSKSASVVCRTKKVRYPSIGRAEVKRGSRDFKQRQGPCTNHTYNTPNPKTIWNELKRRVRRERKDWTCRRRRRRLPVCTRSQWKVEKCEEALTKSRCVQYSTIYILWYQM